ncbi:DNA-binding domain-containing protein [Carboxylicivirga sp. M1479]|uniref:DNA-binding domain-containing protein n=1 Tax=Carboxylicivirga sp. M1479 TaxID=2594476 RepID=UPI001178AAAE|nr:DNA-binding domain-containing protein [Carboxylicivirga sp. M1479]TRX71808.1 DUF4469 domain-containing protein [Carboxylicivirga sp. M1479]
MPLKYRLTPNTLRTYSGKYLAIPSDNESHTMDDIIEMMIAKGSTVTKAEALAVIEEYHQAIETLITEGARVQTELFSISSSINGCFNSESESFNRDHHHVSINLKAEKRLKNCLHKIKVKKLNTAKREPSIQSLLNHFNKSKDSNFSAGQLLSIKGVYLKFNEADPQQGVYFIDKHKTSFKASNVIKNKPGELMCFIPDALTKGNFTLEIRAMVYRTKTIRTGSCTISIV